MAKILIVDDDLVYAKIYKQKLENAGYTIEIANDGEEALVKAAKFAPDLIMLDVMMPKLDGFEVLKKLKADPKTQKIKVVLLTNLGGDDSDTARGMEYGAASYLVKASYTPKQVVEKVAEILSEQDK